MVSKRAGRPWLPEGWLCTNPVQLNPEGGQTLHGRREGEGGGHAKPGAIWFLSGSAVPSHRPVFRLCWLPAGLSELTRLRQASFQPLPCVVCCLRLRWEQKPGSGEGKEKEMTPPPLLTLKHQMCWWGERRGEGEVCTLSIWVSVGSFPPEKRCFRMVLAL